MPRPLAFTQTARHLRAPRPRRHTTRCTQTPPPSAHPARPGASATAAATHLWRTLLTHGPTHATPPSDPGAPDTASTLTQHLPLPPSPPFHDTTPTELLSRLSTHAKHPSHARAKARLHHALRDLRGHAHALADVASPLLHTHASATPSAPAVDALLTLLDLSAHQTLPSLPSPVPPSPDALPLAVPFSHTLDPTLLRASLRARRLLDACVDEHGEGYPFVFAASRGVVLIEKSGVLLAQKLRVLERTYLGWVTTPFALVFRPVVTALARLRALVAPATPDAPALAPAHTGGTVRRVVPVVKLAATWRALRDLLRSTRTQEPAHGTFLLLYRPVASRLAAIRASRRAALASQLRATVASAVSPTPPGRRERERERAREMGVEAGANGLRTPPGTPGDICLELHSRVRWGLERHVYPGAYVLPATLDLLRVDVVTLAALAGAGVLWLRGGDGVAVGLVLGLVSYVVRVGAGWRAAVTGYRGRLEREKATGLVARGDAALRVLAEMAASEAFVEAANVVVREELGGVVASEIFRGMRVRGGDWGKLLDELSRD